MKYAVAFILPQLTVLTRHVNADTMTDAIDVASRDPRSESENAIAILACIEDDGPCLIEALIRARPVKP